MDISDSDSFDSFDSKDNGSDLNDFIVPDDGKVLESKEYKDLIKKIRQPKLHLNPYPTINTSDSNKKLDYTKKFTSEKERIKWLIENKLGPNMTLAEYAKYLYDEEKRNAKNFNKKR